MSIFTDTLYILEISIDILYFSNLGWWGPTSKEREKSEDRGERREEGRERERENREKRGEWVSRVTWTPRQHLTVILTSFDHFNDLSHDMG